MSQNKCICQNVLKHFSNFVNVKLRFNGRKHDTLHGMFRSHHHHNKANVKKPLAEVTCELKII